MSITTIKVDTSTRDSLRDLMSGEATYDSLLRRMIRSERRRRMAAEMADYVPTPDEQMILDTAGRALHARR